MSFFLRYFALGNKTETIMRKLAHFLFVEHPARLLVTVGLIALAIHWGFFGFMLLSVPIFVMWERYF